MKVVTSMLVTYAAYYMLKTKFASDKSEMWVTVSAASVTNILYINFSVGNKHQKDVTNTQ